MGFILPWSFDVLSIYDKRKSQNSKSAKHQYNLAVDSYFAQFWTDGDVGKVHIQLIHLEFVQHLSLILQAAEMPLFHTKSP